MMSMSTTMSFAVSSSMSTSSGDLSYAVEYEVHQESSSSESEEGKACFHNGIWEVSYDDDEKTSSRWSKEHDHYQEASTISDYFSE